MASLLVGVAGTTFTGAGGAALAATGAAAAGTAATTGFIGTAGAVTAGGVLAATGVGVAGLGVLQQGRAAEAEAKSAKNIAAFNAQVKKREAEARRLRGKFAQKRQAKRGARVKAELTADVAAAGGLGSPVAADLAVEQAEELELENLLLGFEGEVLAKRAESQAELDRLSGRLAKQRGKATARAARIGVGTTLLTGFGGRFA